MLLENLLEARKGKKVTKSKWRVNDTIEEIETPTSANIERAEYNRTRSSLRVYFSNGSGYEFDDFGPRKWANFKKAPAKGKYFANKIRKEWDDYPLYYRRIQ